MNTTMPWTIEKRLGHNDQPREFRIDRLGLMHFPTDDEAKIWAHVQELQQRIAELETQLAEKETQVTEKQKKK